MLLIPVLAVIACGWLMLNLSVETWLRFFVWTAALGVVIYFVYSRRHSVLGRRRLASRAAFPEDEQLSETNVTPVRVS